MEELIQQLIKQVGLDANQAKQVMGVVSTFLKDKLPADLMNQLNSAVGGLGDAADAAKDAAAGAAGAAQDAAGAAGDAAGAAADKAGDTAGGLMSKLTGMLGGSDK